ncbi:deoxynucleoside triphosphate triphosphohydrolase SAMHD1-like [Cyprinus carpio]|uniref:Deoxynucleoside triphosphate triphosphohydrolase SAMHD1-like n=1 Tax=Cyprinus carpio TaxID=7962 RepID=A0A9Q9VVI4_CYPCA|nr:deoxynucleoside triphosphate triphosphohydrolase SAMHD1-like [Cyprinus carpio]
MSASEGTKEEERPMKIAEDLQKYSLRISKDIFKVFNDPVHGHMELHPLLVKIIDTPQFQRLRHLKQLGTKYLIYPGATHSRFAHSIGVAYLAEWFVETLRANQPELNITKQDSLCVQIAALCHDLGHGPFSHLFDGMFIPEVQPDNKWQHEQASVQMFHCMRKKNGLDKMMKDYELNLKKDIIFIEELIQGRKTSDSPWTAKGRPEDKSFLYEIVANKLNGIDVDKWDYLSRDCHYLGIPNGFDHQRLLKSARVCEVDGRNHICFRDKVADNVYDMFRTQYTLYSQAYQHKIGNISQTKIIDALLEARDKLPKISPIAVSKLQDDIERKIRRITGVSSHTHEDDENSTKLNGEMREFAKLTDHIFEEILYSSDVGLEGARKKLEDVVKRRLPKCVGETRLINRDNLDNKKALNQTLQNKWNKAVDEWNKLHPAVFLDKKDFSTEVIQLDCTHSTGKNPIDNVYFYRKWNLTEAFKIKKYEVSSLLPEEFTEYVGRVYYTKNSEEEEKDAKECFGWWCRDKCNILVYDQEEFRGNERLITGDCPSLDDCGIKEVQSCKVRRGFWKLFEGHDYNDAEFLLEPGKEYHILLGRGMRQGLDAERRAL